MFIPCAFKAAYPICNPNVQCGVVTQNGCDAPDEKYSPTRLKETAVGVTRNMLNELSF
jgi:hypothetical protein